MKRCAVISGGAFSPLTGIEEHDCIIACDRGLEYASRCGIKPDVVIGDFDSFRGELPEGVEIQRLPVEKDDTDTVSAVRRALTDGAEDITLYCALGGRLDHLTANLQTLAFAVEHGARAHIIDSSTEIHAFTRGSMELPAREDWSLSVFSLTDACTGVSISGTKYLLDNVTVTNAFPIGVSNEWRGTAKVSVDDGTLMVMLCKMN